MRKIYFGDIESYLEMAKKNNVEIQTKSWQTMGEDRITGTFTLNNIQYNFIEPAQLFALSTGDVFVDIGTKVGEQPVYGYQVLSGKSTNKVTVRCRKVCITEEREVIPLKEEAEIDMWSGVTLIK